MSRQARRQTGVLAVLAEWLDEIAPPCLTATVEENRKWGCAECGATVADRRACLVRQAEAEARKRSRKVDAGAATPGTGGR